ncbi:MAG TPA: PDZ domain-containing protein [Gemmatimonadaceae bacterium]|nr:PDZ domain-containing protein [Gemmatimonadaceae bacterium]
MRYAFILAAMLLAPAGLAKAAAPASLSTPGWLGLGYTFNVTGATTGRTVWLFVRQIAPGGPAERAGLRAQDVITEINGNKITFSDELETLDFFNGIRAGQRVQLKVARGRAILTVTIVAGPLPPERVEQRRINAALAKGKRRP